MNQKRKELFLFDHRIHDRKNNKKGTTKSKEKIKTWQVYTKEKKWPIYAREEMVQRRNLRRDKRDRSGFRESVRNTELRKKWSPGIPGMDMHGGETSREMEPWSPLMPRQWWEPQSRREQPQCWPRRQQLQRSRPAGQREWKQKRPQPAGQR